MSANGEDLVLGIAGATSQAGNESYDPNRAGDIDVYHLTRTGAGWQYAALTPPATRFNRSALLGVSSDPTLSTTLWGAQVSGDVPHKEDVYLQREGGQLVPVGPGEAPELANVELGSSEELGMVGASNDLTRSVFAVSSQIVDGHSTLWPGDTTESGQQSLYAYDYAGTQLPEPLLVGVKNNGPLASNTDAQLISSCGTELGSTNGASAYNAVSADGEAIFFTARQCSPGPVVNELYARIGAATTVDISEPSGGDCEACNTVTGLQNAEFAGASRDGEKAFFTTSQELLPGQAGQNLYEYDFKGDTGKKIRLVSFGSSQPEVQGVVRVSEDGSHVYFVAKGKLAGANQEGESPEAGADNLYVYEPDPADVQASRVVFVAKLLTEAEEATLKEEEEREGTRIVEEALATYKATEEVILAEFQHGEVGLPRAFELLEEALKAAEGFIEKTKGTRGPSGTLQEDASVWSGTDRRPAQATPDGRFLVFLSSADLRVEGLAKVPQLFEYDAEGGLARDGALTRVSIGQGGASDSDGNASTFEDAPQIPSQSFRAVDLPTAAQFQLTLSDDGSKVLFTSAAPLTQTATSGALSVFEYSQGHVYLVSDGKDASDTGIGTSSVGLYGTDPSGNDVFFTTADSLVPQTGETQQALYDAREEGGFAAPGIVTGCAGDTCRGSTSVPPDLLAPGSAGQAAGDNLEPSPAPRVKPPLTRAQKLARAMKACMHLPRKRRVACRARAQRLYGKTVRPTRSRSHNSRASGRHHGNRRSK